MNLYNNYNASNPGMHKCLATLFYHSIIILKIMLVKV